MIIKLLVTNIFIKISIIIDYKKFLKLLAILKILQYCNCIYIECLANNFA